MKWIHFFACPIKPSQLSTGRMPYQVISCVPFIATFLLPSDFWSPIIGSVDVKYEDVQHMQHLIGYAIWLCKQLIMCHSHEKTDKSTSYRTLMRDNVIKIRSQRCFSSVIFIIMCSSKYKAIKTTAERKDFNKFCKSCHG